MTSRRDRRSSSFERLFFCAPFCATEVNASATLAASAAAARDLGYDGLADMIEAEQLSPERILALFKLSMSKRASHDCAVVLFAGSSARYRAAPQGWDGHLRGAARHRGTCKRTESHRRLRQDEPRSSEARN